MCLQNHLCYFRIYFIDYLIRLENIEKDLRALGDRLEIQYTGEIPHFNNNDDFMPRTPYREYYDIESKNLIKYAFEWDIDMFKYVF